MKNFFYFLIICGLVASCNSAKNNSSNREQLSIKDQDTVRISNDDIEYEIIIIEPGFNSWLVSIAKPEGYYSQQFMEGRNLQYVREWNSRVLQPSRYGNMYELQIDYDQFTDYGYEVNYKLYNYFIYFQLKYKQRLSGFVPRI